MEDKLSLKFGAKFHTNLHANYYLKVPRELDQSHASQMTKVMTRDISLLGQFNWREKN